MGGVAKSRPDAESGINNLPPAHAGGGRLYGGLAMYAFTFHRPQTVRQAAGLLGKNPDAKLLAGGQTLLPTMKLRLAGPPQIIDMSLIEGMSGIELSGRAHTIGAMTRHNEVNTSPVVQQAIPVLAKVAVMIGDPAVHHLGTIRRSGA